MTEKGADIGIKKTVKLDNSEIKFLSEICFGDTTRLKNHQQVLDLHKF